jgi:hypothetical protein
MGCLKTRDSCVDQCLGTCPTTKRSEFKNVNEAEIRCSVVVLQDSQIRRSIVAATNSGVSLTLALEAEHWGCVGELFWHSCQEPTGRPKSKFMGRRACTYSELDSLPAQEGKPDPMILAPNKSD